MTEATVEAVADTHIKCAICGAKIHSVHLHIKEFHADTSLDAYKRQFPDAPLFSETAQRAMEKRREQLAREAAKVATAPVTVGLTVSADHHRATTPPLKKAFHETFGLPKVAQTLSSSGKEIMISVLQPDPRDLQMVPDVDPNYVFNVDILKDVLMAIEMGDPCYLWGHAGVGKSTIYEQIAAHTHRPLLRVQHTANMEEADVVGGWRLRDSKTVFEAGPLVNAMRNGWLYLADEYDFARPEVTSVYQAVLEGKPLVIKEADDANRVVRPHPNFRIVATGNTNGQGDETGLYVGTNLQNAANYERFAVVQRMPYMDPKLEARLVSQQARIPMEEAKLMVDFATRIRQEFDAGKLGNPISPRSLIFAAKYGVAKRDYKKGLELSFINRLSATDREAALQVAQRVFS